MSSSQTYFEIYIRKGTCRIGNICATISEEEINVEIFFLSQRKRVIARMPGRCQQRQFQQTEDFTKSMVIGLRGTD
ncbi:hypothetical protein TNCV_3391891 [Trichonephila clavipes]|nr:hypothetical protein TNCV_3391891 [Trichonephila clavipes]